MGVHGLWQLINPVARPMALETLGNKKLAIDSSIWVYQFQLSMRDKEGRALDNAHILGFLRRITKLLYYGIKPVFVFDGGAPVIKRVAISERKKRKRGGAEGLKKTAEKLLAAQMRKAAVEDMQKRQQMEETGDYIGEDALYQDDLEPGIQPRGAPAQTFLANDDNPPPAKKKKYVHRDQYALPELEESIQAKATLQDPRMATEAELRDFIDDLRPEDFDVDGEWFAGLSTEVKYEIIGDLRIKSRQNNHKRVDQMRQAATPLDFSKSQIKYLMQRNDLTQKLLTVSDDISNANISIPVRIASERNKSYVLVKNDAASGGGWVLGVRDPAPQGSKSSPVKIDVTTESDTTHSENESEDFEAVPIPEAPRHSSPDPIERKRHAFEAIQRRYAPVQQEEEDDSAIFDRPPQPMENPLFATFDDGPPPALNDSLLAAADQDPSLLEDIRRELIKFDNAASSNSTFPETFGSRANTSWATASLHNSRRPTASGSGSNSYQQGSPSTSDDDFDEVVVPTPQKSKAAPTQIDDSDSDISVEEVQPQREMKSLPKRARSPSQEKGKQPAVRQATPTARSSPVPAASASQISGGVVQRDYASRPALPTRLSSNHRNARTQADQPAPLRQSQQASHASSTSIRPSPLPKSAPTPSTSSARPSPFPSVSRYSTQDGSGDVDFTSAEFDQGPSLIDAALAANDSDSDRELPKSPVKPRVSSQQMDYSPRTGTPVETIRTAEQSVSQADADGMFSLEASYMPLTSDAPRSPVVQSPAPLFQTIEDSITPPVAASISQGPQNPGLSSETIPDPVIRKVAPTDVASHDPTAQLELQEERTRAINPDQADEPAKTTTPQSPNEEDEEAIAWSPSPSPPPRSAPSAALTPKVSAQSSSHEPSFDTTALEDFPLAAPGHELSDTEPDALEEEEAQNHANLLAEEGHFSTLFEDLRKRDLNEMSHELDAEIRQLNQQRVKDRRNADEITTQMSKDIQRMLALFGLPYVTAPMEAEAQCAELVQRNLVDGIITDDSDVFLFGGTRVYKNLFNQNKYVECYLLSDLEREFSLSRERLIQLAHFLGSDYTEGLPGVGPVIGMELMNEFAGPNGLMEFRKWWTKVQKGQDTPEDNKSAFRRRFKKSKKNLFLDESWPNPAVAEAYWKPEVDSSDGRFEWGIPDLDGLRSYLAEVLGWGAHKVDDLLTPLIKRMNQRNQGVANMQGTLDKFFEVTGGTGRFAPHTKIGYHSARLQNVIKEFRKTTNNPNRDADIKSDSSSEEEVRPKPIKRRSAAKKKSASNSPAISRKNSSSPAISRKASTSPTVTRRNTRQEVSQAQEVPQQQNPPALPGPVPAQASNSHGPPPKKRQMKAAPTQPGIKPRKLGSRRSRKERKELEIASDDSGFD